ncbi:stability protein StbE [Salmonella enterica]|nr:stability protein StbE [Salmonella enterica]
MTYKLAFNESALKEWKKLGHTIQEQFKKKGDICPSPLS